jgi:hypothetical protein
MANPWRFNRLNVLKGYECEHNPVKAFVLCPRMQVKQESKSYEKKSI